MAAPAIDTRELEKLLLRRAVGALETDRCRCSDCGRTPLTGEWVHLYGGRRRRLVCELCRLLRREEPEESAPVREGPTGNVRISQRAG
jgi:hypothetical protein